MSGEASTAVDTVAAAPDQGPKQPRKRAGGPRSRTGCLTCRNRKKKCDGGYPICEQCRRLNYSCLREDPRPPVPANAQTWKTPPKVLVGADPQEPLDHVEFAPLYRQPENVVFQNQGNQEMVSNRRMTLQYYIQTFSPLMSTNTQNNSFLSVFLPMAMDSPILLNAIVACSSSHLAMKDDSFSRVALQLRTASFSSLSASLASKERSPDLELASCLVLCAMESILGDTGLWYYHLAGAFEVMRTAGVLQLNSDGMFVPSGFLNTSDGRWLLRNFAYHDVMMSVTMGQKPFMPGQYWATQEDLAEPSADSYFGLASRVIFLVSEVSILAADMDNDKARRDCESLITELSDNESDNRSDPSPSPGSPPGSTIDFSRRANKLDNDLTIFACSPSLDLCLIGQAEAYRSAGLIHLYRSLRRHIPSLKPTLDAKIANQVRSIVDTFELSLPPGCLPECTLLFPLFMAGGEAVLEEHIRIIRARMLGILETRLFQNVKKALDVLDELWRLRAGGLEVDWIDVLRRREWKLALS